MKKTDCVYTPQQYAQLIVKSSRSGCFSIHKVQIHETLSFKNWWLHSNKKNINSDETSEISIKKEYRTPFKISTYKHSIFRQSSPGKVEAKTISNGITMSTFSFKKTTCLPEQPTLKAYPFGKVQINSWSSEAAVSYCDEFYNMILSSLTSVVEKRVNSGYEEPWKNILIFFIFDFPKNLKTVYGF